MEPLQQNKTYDFNDLFAFSAAEYGEDFNLYDIRIKLYTRLGTLCDLLSTYNKNLVNPEENVTIEIPDLETWRRDMIRMKREIQTGEKGLIVCDDDGRFPVALAAEDAEVEQARAEAAALREENAALKAALEQARQERKAQGGESLTPQQKAAQVRSETALNAWKPKIGAMVKVAVQIGKEGPKERQAGDFYAYFNELDVYLTNEQMKVFRAGVPDEYKDTVGGKVGKT